MSCFKQKDVERAVRAAIKSGFVLARIDFRPDGFFSLCSGSSGDDKGVDLDSELDRWRRSNAAN